MTSKSRKTVSFEELPKDVQEKLKAMAKWREAHHHELYEEVLERYPELPEPDACHRYLEDHHQEE